MIVLGQLSFIQYVKWVDVYHIYFIVIFVYIIQTVSFLDWTVNQFYSLTSGIVFVHCYGDIDLLRYVYINLNICLFSRYVMACLFFNKFLGSLMVCDHSMSQLYFLINIVYPWIDIVPCVCLLQKSMDLVSLFNIIESTVSPFSKFLFTWK